MNFNKNLKKPTALDSVHSGQNNLPGSLLDAVV